ncbi:hypothetical protein BDK51DRAFT_52153, partial [Blyttiomyces helicus]
PDADPPTNGRAAGGYGSRRPDRAFIVIAGDDGGADEDQDEDQDEIEDDEDQVPVHDEDEDEDGKGETDHDDSLVNEIDNDQCNRADDAHDRCCLVNTLADHAEPCDHNGRIRTNHPHDRAGPADSLAGQYRSHDHGHNLHNRPDAPTSVHGIRSRPLIIEKGTWRKAWRQGRRQVAVARRLCVSKRFCDNYVQQRSGVAWRGELDQRLARE